MATKIAGIIPAAGQGTRLGPMPGCKELFPIGFQAYNVEGQTIYYPKAISQYLVEGLVGAGAEEIFIILGKEKHDIMNFYGDSLVTVHL